MINDEEVTRQTLESVPGRAFDFVMGVGMVPAIRAILEEFGYNDDEHVLAWTLLQRIGNYKPQGQVFHIQTDQTVRAAVITLDQWDEPNFARARAALQRLFKAQCDFVFEDLEAAEGVAAVQSVATFLERLDALENSKDRKATHKEDHEALKLLAKRGITKAERVRLAGLVETAQRGAEAAAPVVTDEARAADRAQAMKDLYAWYQDWSTVARTEIRRRDYLIRLNLATRRSPVKADKGENGSGTDGGGTGGK